MLANIIIILVVAAIFIYCLRKVIISMKKGECSDCKGGCGSCSGGCSGGACASQTDKRN